MQITEKRSTEMPMFSVVSGPAIFQQVPRRNSAKSAKNNQSQKCAINNFWTKISAGLLGFRGAKQNYLC